MSDRILILEHDSDTRKTFVTALTGAGYTVTVANTPEEALELVWESYDVAIVDLSWDGVAAGDVIRRLRTIDSQVLVIVTALGSSTAVIGQLTNLGAAAYCIKPADGAAIRWEVRRCLDQRRLHRVEETVTQLFHAVNSAYDGIVIADIGGRITYTNHAVRELFGYEQDELIGKSVEVLNPAYTQNREMITSMLAKDGWSGEIMTFRKDRSWFPILLSTSLVRDETGKPVAIMGIVKDLSEVKRAEAEISRRNLELSALNQVTEAISRSEFDEVVMIALARVIEATGLEMGVVHLLDDERAELVMAASNGLPREYEQMIQRVKISENVLGQVFRSGDSIYAEDVRKDSRLGQIASLDIDVAAFAMVPLHARDRVIGTMSVGSCRPHRFDEHETGLIATMGQQVGLAVEKAQLFQQVSQDKREWEDTFDAITDLISVQDMNGCIVRVNRALMDRLQLPREQLVGRPWHKVLLRSEQKGDWVERLLCDDHIESIVEEVNGLVIEGTFVLSVFPRFDDNRERIGSVVVFRDITEHRRLEEQIWRLDRLSSLGELSAGIAHEIRNPLSSVKLDTQLLARQLDPNPRQRKIVGNILDAIGKIEHVVQNTLNYARPEEPEFRSSNLPEVVEQSLGLVQAQLKKAGIRTNLDVSSRISPIFVDPDQIQQVFVNLFLNAINAMPSGGVLSIWIRQEEQTVAVTIHDTGDGIDPLHVDKIFNPFFTTRSRGTGLGLSIVQRILERHHASIEVDSRPGVGATFLLHFPFNVQNS